MRTTIAYLADATEDEKRRVAAFLAAYPDARIAPDSSGEWYCDLPDGIMHARTLGLLLGRLDDLMDAARLARYRGAAFRREHPEVTILLVGDRLPRAWVGREKITRGSLRSLLDYLDDQFGPGG